MTPEAKKALREAVQLRKLADGPLGPRLYKNIPREAADAAASLIRDHADELLSLVGERQKLESIAHHAWHLLDDSCDDGNEVTVERDDYDALAVAIDELVGAHGDIHDFLKLPAPPQDQENP